MDPQESATARDVFGQRRPARFVEDLAAGRQEHDGVVAVQGAQGLLGGVDLEPVFGAQSTEGGHAGGYGNVPVRGGRRVHEDLAVRHACSGARRDSSAGEGHPAAQNVLAGIEYAAQCRQGCARVQEVRARQRQYDDAFAG